MATNFLDQLEAKFEALENDIAGLNAKLEKKDSFFRRFLMILTPALVAGALTLLGTTWTNSANDKGNITDSVAEIMQSDSKDISSKIEEIEWLFISRAIQDRERNMSIEEIQKVFDELINDASGSTPTVFGQILDYANNPVANVKVEIIKVVNGKENIIASTTTNLLGSFDLKLPGDTSENLVFRASKPGFDTEAFGFDRSLEGYNRMTIELIQS